MFELPHAASPNDRIIHTASEDFFRNDATSTAEVQSTMIVAIIFWIALIIWGLDLFRGRAGLRGLLPWICVLCLGLIVITWPFHLNLR